MISKKKIVSVIIVCLFIVNLVAASVFATVETAPSAKVKLEAAYIEAFWLANVTVTNLPSAVKYKIFEGETAISSVWGISEKAILAKSAVNVGDVVTIKFYASDGVTIVGSPMSVTLLDINAPEITPTPAPTVTPTPAPVPDKPVVKAVDDNDKKVTGTAIVDTVITVKVGSATIGEAAVNDDKTFSVTIEAQKAGTTLSITATNEYEIVSPAAIVKVSDKTAPVISKVNTVKSTYKHVSGKTESKAGVYVKTKIKTKMTTLGYARAKSNGEFYVTYKKAQKTGTYLYIYAKDAAGNTSLAKKIKVVR